MTDHHDLYWTTARTVCTPDELIILQYAERGLGRRRIALLTHTSPSTARDKLNRARQKIAEALEQGAAA